MAPPSWWPLTTHYLFAEGMVTFDAARWRLVTRAGSEHQELLQAPDNPYTRYTATCCAASTGRRRADQRLGSPPPTWRWYSRLRISFIRSQCRRPAR